MVPVPDEHQTRLTEVAIWLIDSVEMEGELIGWATHGDVTERSDTAKRRELAESLFNKLINANALDGLSADEIELFESAFSSRLDLLSTRITQTDASFNLFKRRSRLLEATKAYDATRAARDWFKENRPEPRPALESLDVAPAVASASVEVSSIDR